MVDAEDSDPAAEEADVLDELARLPTMAHPTVSPDGDRVALYYDITGRNELHVLDVESGDLEQWSNGEVPRNARWYLQWGPRGERIFYHDDEAGDEQNDIYVATPDGVEPVVEMPGQTMIHDVSEEGILFGGSRDGQMNLYFLTFATGAVEKLTEYDRAVWVALLSPDGERIAYATNETDDFDNRDVYVAAADGSDPRNLEIGAVGAESTPVAWSGDGRRLLVGDNTEDLGRVGVYDLDAAETVWHGDGTYEETPVSFLPDGSILASRDREAGTTLVVYGGEGDTGAGRELDIPAGVATVGMFPPFRVQTADGRLVFQHTTPTKRPELLAYDRDRDEYEVILDAEYGPFAPEDFADAEYFTITSDGVADTPAKAVEHDPAPELEIGALLYDAGVRPSPLVVNPHGGPRGRDETSFDLYTQVLVASGYSVLQVNYRGSTGKGRAFVEELIEDWGGAEQGDIATAAEHVLATRDWLDEDRVAVFGGSYGGYSAYWQLVQYPALYDAGVAWIGLTDLTDQYENTMPHYRTELMEKYLGTPADNPDLYSERSPIEYVENLAAPVLVVHGVNDRRVPVSQARRFRNALEKAGYEAGEDGDFEYRELGAEGHASTDQAQKLRMFELLTDFLDRRLDSQ